MADPALANDTYSATLRSIWVADPPDATLAVTAIPVNTPTIITVGWNTQYETVFTVTGTSGTDSSNYALTGVTRLKGVDRNLPEGTALNCLNHEEYFNQWGTLIAAIQDTVDAWEAAGPVTETDEQTLTNKRITKRVITIVSNATPTVNTDDCDMVSITALTEEITSMTDNLSGTPTNGQVLIFRILDDGGGEAITWGAKFEARGIALPIITTASKLLTVGFIYDTVDDIWGCVASVEEA